MARQTFIDSVAAFVLEKKVSLDSLTVVFPNRRAALYFRKSLAARLTAPQWSPKVLSIEEFIERYSPLQQCDKLALILKLYDIFKEVTRSEEELDHFFFWGEMLLRDFDELDKYLVNAELMFRDLSNQKELDHYFDYLTEEQKKFLMEFWQSLEINASESKEKFLQLWRNLFPIYKAFREHLSKEGLAYAGMIHREVAENATLFKGLFPEEHHYVFAGFNALTTAEEMILSWFVENRNAEILWDEDAYYVNKTYREAGAFFRQYRAHPILKNTFPEQPPTQFQTPPKISLVGVPQKAGQPKLLAEQLESLLNTQPNFDRTVIVLPDESLLLPVMYALPTSIDPINITMGFSLVNTPFYNLIDFLFELHLHKRQQDFYYRYVLGILNHPYVKSKASSSVDVLRKDILKRNQVYLAPEVFASHGELLSMIFTPIDHHSFLTYALQIIEWLATHSQGGLMEKEFAFSFHRLLTRIKTVTAHEPMELRMQQRLYRQIVRTEKVPFTGEPLKGLQVMGVLETRNLDFDHVIVLSLNEGLWPAAPKQGSYIPHNIRKAYTLPTAEHQDAMYAYLFYRLLQRSENVDLYYNTETDIVGMGEMSRYLYQLLHESQWPIDKKILYNPVRIEKVNPIVIEKDKAVLEKLTKFSGKALTPSSLKVYLECRLKFYFRYVIELKEPEKVEEEADSRIFGNIVHDVMEHFYRDLKPPAGSWEIRKEHFANIEVKVERLILEAFKRHFFIEENKPFTYDGSQLVVKEMVKVFVELILNQDERYTPFTIEILEDNNFNTKVSVDVNGKVIPVAVGGKIDRVDRKDNVVRIMDYKTGGDENAFASIEALFQREVEKRNSAAFQAILYTWIFDRTRPTDSLTLKPGLLNRKESFKEDFEYGLLLGKQRMHDAKPYLEEFETHFMALLKDLYDPNQPFDQTNISKTCSYCPYKGICRR
jgi:CRISPR/Cas system-associated exonuclease Cas4 (RecB family)